ncbi:hypothetical protein AB2B41_21210 [Marimonas sp. MJW-29]|uniref:Uncharacterized protein n=1 Tax=Sulfitobacter sediminis TaxID=3234186 RepID=A0ABV3RUX6_9RHOB
MSEGTKAFQAVLLPVLASHFPNALASDLEAESLRIALAVVLDGKDEFSLERHMATARDLSTLEEIGRLMQELAELVGKLHPDTQVSFLKARYEHDPEASFSSNRTLFLERFENEVDRMARGFRVVEEAVQSTGPWVSRPNGKPRTDTSVMVAWVTGIAFDRLSEDRPNIVDDPNTSKASGPFLELVTDVFRVLEIHHSPKENAKRAVAAISENKHPITGGYSPFLV